LSSSNPPSTHYKESGRPASITFAGLFLIIVGLLSFLNSYFILTSPVILGWFIIGIIGLGSLICGLGLLQTADWAYSGGLTIAVLNFFIGAIEILGSFDQSHQIMGIGAGQLIGALTLLFTVLAMAFLYRKETREYYNKNVLYAQS